MSIVMNLISVPSYIRWATQVMGEGDWLLLIFAWWQLGILILYIILWKLAESLQNKKESE
jgi:hypothetical protein